MTYQQLLARYREKHGALIRPKSLHTDLHLAYSMGIKRSFTNLGTYANKPGDHGYYPARAFDLGRKNRFFNKGWNYLVARNLAKLYWENRVSLNIDYVILGNKIASRRYASQGFRYFTNYPNDRSHDFHIHVSMWWPEKDL